MKILQVVGFSNSGKTTLLEKLITQGRAKGMKLATIKHHGHGSPLTALDKGKDSYKHRQAGAVASAVSSNGELQVQMSKPAPWRLEDIFSLYRSLHLDGVFIEGYKHELYAKIVLLKDEKEVVLLRELQKVIAVIVWEDAAQLQQIVDVPVFTIHEEERYLSYLINWLEV
ncbi:molybdopterin-guanine dinucleotide biosynthesis [Halalkalibacterium halodurans C-125]|uniref:Molybdopterin-guanine dinucleotide biosynthesis n=1 Tax=Halalkalibacterium halodurans (strain ATCC BAA-125 / DSM 18197 / FERM 7344 / JCM 9153 / C-125) TaxID=272558 RepID=Q9K8I6_HALH5|nr:molybdopterin-guanine dinucleotide biosynthesis protein B [Halalkalibacterium halodurans]BAB06739.1 molybdopterin-guanine dinucleotide biosynthesis [Halalkalibacterium halodurans C-125]